MTSNDALVESWVLSLHQKSPRTIEVYVRELRRFERWLADHGDPDFSAVTRRDVQLWIAQQQKAGLLDSTIRSRWIALKAFYRWASVEEQEIESNPMVGVTAARGESKAPDPLSPDVIAALLKACEGAGFMERRDLALIRFTLATGGRAQEAVGVQLGDVDLASRVAAITKGKGRKQRVARFDPVTAAAIDRYKRVRARHRHASLPWLWIGERGRTTEKGLASILRKRGALAGIEVHPHQLRHTFADRFLDNGGSEGDLMTLGGWESPEMMRLYGRARKVNRAISNYDDVDPMRGL